MRRSGWRWRGGRGARRGPRPLRCSVRSASKAARACIRTSSPAGCASGPRAAFLRTIVQDSRFVLLGEPFSALDAVTRLRMQDWLHARLAEAPRGVLMVTHDLHEATQMADRLLVMSATSGVIVADIALDAPREARTEAALAETRTELRSLLLEDIP